MDGTRFNQVVVGMAMSIQMGTLVMAFGSKGAYEIVSGKLVWRLGRTFVRAYKEERDRGKVS